MLILSDLFYSLVWGGCALVVFVWAYFRLSETKGRTFDELDTLFAKRVPARKFASTDVDAFNEEVNDQLAAQYARA
jgi:SP family general alpha glucoside:H+ symporter-like MFS transporter